jgi:hypothetical protein
LGEPIELGFWISGSINISGPTGNADFSVPLSGPKGAGRLYIVGEKSAGKWSFDLLEVEIDGRDERIDLLEVSEADRMVRRSVLPNHWGGAVGGIVVRIVGMCRGRPDQGVRSEPREIQASHS